MSDNPYRGHACEGDDCEGCSCESSWDEGFAAARRADRNTEGVWPDQSAGSDGEDRPDET